MEGMGLGAICDGYGSRHIVLRHSASDCGFTSIDDAHELYHPLAYVLLFPTGAVGWSGELSRLNDNLEEIGSLSLHQWARYLIMRRLGGLSHLQRCAALTSEFWCDVWAQIESRNLGYLRRAATQHSIRSSHFAAVDDAARIRHSQSEDVGWVIPAHYKSINITSRQKNPGRRCESGSTYFPVNLWQKNHSMS